MRERVPDRAGEGVSYERAEPMIPAVGELGLAL